MVKIENFVPYTGEHCETTATGNLLRHAGLEISEQMMFGLGEGLAFGIFSFKNMGAPFIGGRTKPDEVTKKLTEHLGIRCEYRTTRSRKRAWENVASFVDAGQPVAVKLDMYYLDYFNYDFHFAGHYLTVWGYDDQRVYVVDTGKQDRSLSTARDTFEEGRLWKGPMASDALTWTISLEGDVDIKSALPIAIKANVETYLNPPIRNFGATGIRKAAKSVVTWAEELTVDAMQQVAMVMEQGGTGGSLFRNFYRDFLTEAYTYLNDTNILKARDMFAEVAPMWSSVAEKISSANEKALREASEIMIEIADMEEEAMTILQNL